MNLIQAIKRLSFTTSNGNRSNGGDVDALNVIIQWINKEKEKRINENRYFGKLVIYTLMRELDHFEDINLAERKINDILERPLEYWYDRLRLNFVSRELSLTYNILGIENIAEIWDKHKGKDNYFDMDMIRYDIHEREILIKNNKEEIIKSLLTWPQSEINAKMNIFITELLNEHGNKP
jgi:hypothetical protein